MPFDQRFAFDTELSLAGASFTGSPVFVGKLTNQPVIIMFKNLSTVVAFLSDNNGTTAGTSMAIGEEIIVDCRANAGNAVNGGFPIGTPFYVTAAAGAGAFKISIIYAK